ncbi:hypothetical protein QCA50_011504 [Cerrena zonata]|uniref:N-acetyltransferase domain-containing protein n=1 Tax=Cerrena zonata TaxID=2478898 RepID=A0AAW0G646_9APHY
MSFVNLYTPPAAPGPLPENDLYGPEPYDTNFVFPIHPESLETERVRLTPFVPKVHFEAAWEVLSKHEELFRFYPLVLPNRETFLTYMERGVRQNPTNTMFAIIDKTRPDDTHPEFEGSLAGIVGLYDTSAEQLYTEIAFVMIFPAFQRSHVASNAVGILLKYCLEVPTASPPGLGLRRVQWHCHHNNAGSKRLAGRMGFYCEGTLRWHWVLPEALRKDALPEVRKDDPAGGRPGRHTVSLSVCWDDWENGVREKVAQQIDRKA